MRKRLYIGLAVAFVAITAVMIWRGTREREPVFNGKPLGYWVRVTPVDPDIGLTMESLAFDGKAVPFLLKYLKAHDGPLDRLYWRTWYRLPGWTPTSVSP